MDQNNLKQFLKLECGFQNYEWGKKGNSSMVFKLINNQSQNLDQLKPYAELWMGTHVSLPSFVLFENQIDTKKQKLQEFLLKDSQFYLGKIQTEKQKNQIPSLPFLFKVLSVNQALSIQAHPDKNLAVQLNKSHPNIYKDDNHKPEMCIAITDFECLCKFLEKSELIHNIDSIPEMKELLDQAALQEFRDSQDEKNQKLLLKSLFTSIFQNSDEKVQNQIQKLILRLQQKNDNLSQREKLMLKLNNQYPNDIGVFVSNFLNHFTLKPGQCLVLGANEPHAYIDGDCIECMANSDNVVRSGLTPKLKDIDTLTNMLTYDMGKAPIQEGNLIQELNYIIKSYKSGFEEFNCFYIYGESETQTKYLKSEQCQILLNMGTQIVLNSKFDEKIVLEKGGICFIAANCEYQINLMAQSEIYICSQASEI